MPQELLTPGTNLGIREQRDGAQAIANQRWEGLDAAELPGVGVVLERNTRCKRETRCRIDRIWLETPRGSRIRSAKFGR